MAESEAKKFGIFVKVGLLEPRHCEAIGDSLWLYLFFLNAVTKVHGDIGLVFGGAPVPLKDIEEKLGKMSRTTYWRKLERLEKGGYITTQRAARGLIVKVSKSYKIFGDVSKVEHIEESDVSNMNNDVSEMEHPVSKVKHLLDRTVDRTIDIPTPQPPKGAEEINLLWKSVVGSLYRKDVPEHVRAGLRMQETVGPGQLTQLLQAVRMIRADKYQPRKLQAALTGYAGLEKYWDQVEAYMLARSDEKIITHSRIKGR